MPSSTMVGADQIVDTKGDPVVIAEIKFCQIAMQVLFRAMLIVALHCRV